MQLCQYGGWFYDRFSPEPNVAAPLTKGSTGVFSGVVKLFVQTQGDVTLNVLNFDPVAQEILTDLPDGQIPHLQRFYFMGLVREI